MDRRTQTAFMSAFTRAHHALHDTPKVFDDSLARAFFSDANFATFEHNLTLALGFFDPESAAKQPEPAAALALTMRAIGGAITVGRARFAEDRLLERVGQLRQYVILGAGLDSFAFRHRELEALRIFELDFADTQEVKRRRLAELGWPLPANWRQVPIDFTQQRLPEVLAEAGFVATAPSFFSWLGVSFYLPREAVLATLADVASSAPRGSCVVFDFLEADAFVEGRVAPQMQRMLAGVQRGGTPMITGFESAHLAAELEAVGLRLVEDWDPREIDTRYFVDRADGWRAFPHFHFAMAVVK